MSIFNDLRAAIRANRESKAPEYGGDGFTLLSPQDRKGAPPFQSHGTGPGYALRISDDIRYATTVDQAIKRFAGTKIDFETEAGDLTASSLVMAAVNWTGTTLPEAPIQVKEKNAEGTEKSLDDHELVGLIRRPNNFYSGRTLLKASGLSRIVNGNTYWLKFRNARGKIIQLWYEPHFTIRPVCLKGDFITSYEIWRDGRWRRIEEFDMEYSEKRKDVIHFRNGIDPLNPCLGLSPVASVLREIYTDNEAATYSALLMKNCGVPPLVASPKDSTTAMTADVAKNVEEGINRKMTGDSRGKVAVVSGAIDLHKLAFSYAELGIKEVRRVPEERLAAVIGIPAAVLGFGSGMEQTKVGATMRELREQAYESFVIPTQEEMAEELAVQLLADLDGQENPRRRVCFDLSKVRVLQDDQDKLATRISTLYMSDIITRAQALAALNYPVDEATDNVRYSQAKASLGGQLLDEFESGGKTEDE